MAETGTHASGERATGTSPSANTNAVPPVFVRLRRTVSTESGLPAARCTTSPAAVTVVCPHVRRSRMGSPTTAVHCPVMGSRLPDTSYLVPGSAFVGSEFPESGGRTPHIET